jgi:hypothetical protein
MIDEKDKEFEGVIKTLKELQQLKAPANFETDLMRKINAGNFPGEEAGSWWSSFLVPKRFIPSVALAIAAILLLFVLKPGSSESDNPFNVQPRVRKDIITSTQLSSENKIDKELQKMPEKETQKNEENNISKQNQDIAKSEATGKRILSTKKFGSDEPESLYTSQGYEAVSSLNNFDFYGISKNGLNFRQVNLTQNERREINRLKENLMRFMKQNKLK